MKSMGIRLQYAPEAVPSLHQGICKSPDIDREVIVGGQAVADELECAVSTASELLRHGEANAVERALESGP